MTNVKRFAEEDLERLKTNTYVDEKQEITTYNDHVTGWRTECEGSGSKHRHLQYPVQ
jgi:hypothetical protein